MVSEVLGDNLEARANQMGVADPIYPPPVRTYMKTLPPPGAYSGKKILSVHGGHDFLHPIERSTPYLAAMAEQLPDGDMEVYVDEESGHRCSADMVRKTAEWCWRWGLSA